VENNFILIDVDYNGIRFTAGSVYGANTNEGLPMYDLLQQKITDLGNKHVILGGDFNATFDNSRVEDNIDILNMANIPSVRRSNRILEMCAALDLTDPYRIIYPFTREFTFTPHGVEQLNRSRLDFFLVSKDLCANLVNVIIPHSLSSSTFDHKPVHLLYHKKGDNLTISSKTITFKGKNLKQGSMWLWSNAI
jgi:exonuclease III